MQGDPIIGGICAAQFRWDRRAKRVVREVKLPVCVEAELRRHRALEAVARQVELDDLSAVGQLRRDLSLEVSVHVDGVFEVVPKLLRNMV